MGYLIISGALIMADDKQTIIGQRSFNANSESA